MFRKELLTFDKWFFACCKTCCVVGVLPILFVILSDKFNIMLPNFRL